MTQWHRTRRGRADYINYWYGSARASSQSLSGKLLEEDAEGEQVVSGAAVTLLDALGKELATTATGADGTFTVKVPRAGRYRLRVGALGYETATSELIDVPPNDIVEVLFRISRNPMARPSIDGTYQPTRRG